MRLAILFVVACLVAVAGYAVVGGIVSPPAPRTQAEALLAISRAGVKKSPGDGAMWAQLARVQYLTGAEKDAFETIKSARKQVKDRSILWVNNQELDLYIREGEFKKALKLSDEYVKKDGEIRGKEYVQALAKGINPPLEAQDVDNKSSIQLFLLRANAQMNLKKYDDAIESFDNALLMAPRAADILSLRGAAKLAAGDAEGATADYQEALKFMPKDPEATAGLKAAKAAAGEGSK